MLEMFQSDITPSTVTGDNSWQSLYLMKDLKGAENPQINVIWGRYALHTQNTTAKRKNIYLGFFFLNCISKFII